MATEQWLQNNPKILAYVSRDIHNKLCQFKKDHKIKSISEAVSLILKSFFELEIPLTQPVDEEPSLPGEVTLESRVVSLEQLLSQILGSVENIESNSLLRCISEDSSRQSDLLFLNSKSLNSQPQSSFSSSIDLPTRIECTTYSSRKFSENYSLLLEAKNGALKRKLEKVDHWQSHLSDQDSGGSLSSIQLLVNSLLYHPSCVCLFVFRRSRFIGFIEAGDWYLSLDELENFFYRKFRRRGSPYFTIRRRLESQFNDLKNPLGLDNHGKNLAVTGSRELSDLVKQLSEEDDIMCVYCVSLSMLARSLDRAGLPVTYNNLWKVRQYVKEISQEMIDLVYADFIAHGEIIQARKEREGRGRMYPD